MADIGSLLLKTGAAISPAAMALSLAVALICGFMMSWLYRHTYRGASYSIAFARSLVTLTMITAIVIMVIGNNLARAFGLVGAMSIVRFRTAVKDAQDLVFIFFSLAIGLASGVGLDLLAIGGTVAVGGVIFAMSRLNFGAHHRRELVIQLSWDGDGNTNAAHEYQPIMERYCRTFHLLGARAAAKDVLDLTFYAQLSDPNGAAPLTAALTSLTHARRVNVFYDEEPE